MNRYLSLLFGQVGGDGARSSSAGKARRRRCLALSTAQVQRELEMLGTARRQPLTAFSYCFCDFRQSP